MSMRDDKHHVSRIPCPIVADQGLTAMTALLNPVAEQHRSRKSRKSMNGKNVFAMLKHDIAKARAEMARLEKNHEARVHHEARQAREIRYRQAIDQLERDERRWRRAPDLFRDALGSTWQGAQLLARIWAALVQALDPDSPDLTLELICQVVMAAGSPWKVQQMTQDGWWIMARYLMEHEHQEEQVNLWIKKSRDLEPALQMRRAKMQMMEAMLADSSHDLRSRALQESSHWSAEAERLKAKFEADCEHAAQTAAGTGLGDKLLTQEARMMMALRKAARDHLAKLEKRLDSLRKNRTRELQKLDRQREQALRNRQPIADQPSSSPVLPIAPNHDSTTDSDIISARPSTNTPLSTGDLRTLAELESELAKPVKLEELTRSATRRQLYEDQQKLLKRA